jgi:hypothetical protein
MFETASTLNLLSSDSFEFVAGNVAAALIVFALLLLALKEEKAKKMVSRHTMVVGRKIFFTNQGFFEVIAKRCGSENIMRHHQFQTFLLIFSTAGRN